jgi:hypothetical protein
MTRYAVALDEDATEEEVCHHLDLITDVTTETPPQCVDCITEGTRWIHLRQCLVCGRVGCCDDSPRRHATAHWVASGHPVIRSREPGETWAWCYADELPLVPIDGRL